MNIIFTVLVAFPVGFFVKRRGTAVLTYLVLDALLFAFQSVGVLLSWMADNRPVAFGPSPKGGFPVEYSNGEYLGYGVVNLVIITVGVGLVLIGAKVAARRTARRDAVSVA